MTSGEAPLAAVLHRLRSTLARVQAEAELLELDGVAVGGILEGLGEAFGYLGDAQVAASGGNEDAARVPGEDPRVVVLDDDVRLAALTAQRLQSRGIEASWASSLQALPTAATTASIIVVDLGLLESAKAEELASLPWSRTIIVSGGAAHASQARARLLGAYEFLAKPVNIAELARMVNRLTAASS